MKKSAKAIVVSLVLVIVMAVSGGTAFAGWGWEDCPPASGSAVEHMSPTAEFHVGGLQAPLAANDHATTENPGKKPAPPTVE